MSVRDPQASAQFALGFEFQIQLLKLLTTDSHFAHVVHEHLQPEHFENQVLQWAMGVLIRHRDKYGQFSSMQVVLEETRQLDPKVQAIYRGTIERVMQSAVTDPGWLKDRTLDFIKRAIFVHAFREAKTAFNSGNDIEAYDIMVKRMDSLTRANLEPIARTFFFEDLSVRMGRRTEEEVRASIVATGFPTLDKILGGGLRLGEVGCWMAYPKVGKSTVLQNHGVAAVRGCFKTVLHFVLEGRLAQFEDRYDAAFANAAYYDVKIGNIQYETYTRLREEYGAYRKKLVMRAFTDRWDYTVDDMQEELLRLRQDHQFKPDLIIVDYGDLMTGREKKYRSPYDSQKAAYRDLKSLAGRGYAMWTATQASRPDDGMDVKQHLLRAHDIADCYEKVRILDFLGTINQTLEEKKLGHMRLLPDTARDAKISGQPFAVVDDRQRMRITENTSQFDFIHGKGYAQSPENVERNRGYGFVQPQPAQSY